MIDKIVIDTHILLWSLLNPEHLSPQIQEIISKAQQNDILYISSITLWEIAMLVQKGRVNVYEPIRDFLESISKIDGLNLINISSSIAADSVSLPGSFLSDPADCIIIASTRDIAANLITKDQKIIDYAKQGYIKLISA